MDIKELRELSAEELKSKLRAWEEELFRTRIKFSTSGDLKDTSVFRKIRANIARTKFLLGTKESKSLKEGKEVAANDK